MKKIDKEREPDFIIRTDWNSHNTSTLVRKLLKNVESGDFEIELKAKNGSLLVEILIFTAKIELEILQILLVAYLSDLVHNKKLKKAELINKEEEDIFPSYVG